MFKLIAKAASVEAMLDKQRRGADGIEWQLTDKRNVFVDKLVLPIYNVHTRLYDNEDICLDVAYNHYLGIGRHLKDFDEKNNYAYLIEALELANWLGGTQGFMVNVVTHLYYGGFVQKPEDIAKWIEGLLNVYPYCNILVENSCIAHRSGRFKNMLDVNTVPNFVEELQECLSSKYKDRLGSVLDICHLLSSYRTFMLLVKDEGMQVGEYCGLTSELNYLSDAFCRFSKTCKTIHFNNSKNLGVKKLNHGVVFENDSYDMTLLKHIITLFTKYTKDAKLVLEVREDNVDLAENFEYMVKLLRSLG